MYLRAFEKKSSWSVSVTILVVSYYLHIWNPTDDDKVPSLHRSAAENAIKIDEFDR